MPISHRHRYKNIHQPLRNFNHEGSSQPTTHTNSTLPTQVQRTAGDTHQSTGNQKSKDRIYDRRVQYSPILKLGKSTPMIQKISQGTTPIQNTKCGQIDRIQHNPAKFRDFRLYGNLGPVKERDEFKILVDSIWNLERLHIGHYRFGETDVTYRAKSTKLLIKMFPTLSINVNPFGEMGTSKSNPDNKFRNTIKPRSWIRRLWNKHGLPEGQQSTGNDIKIITHNATNPARPVEADPPNQ